jgi:hypothetical protein
MLVGPVPSPGVFFNSLPGFSSQMGLLPTTPLEKAPGLLNYFDIAIGFGSPTVASPFFVVLPVFRRNPPSKKPCTPAQTTVNLTLKVCWRHLGPRETRNI